MTPALPLFLSASAPLRPSDAAVALLLLPDRRYVMQLRDAVPNIFYPEHWACFGGAIDAGEDPVTALVRELYEELEMTVASDAAHLFTRFEYDMSKLGRGKVVRHYYEIQVSDDAFGNVVLHEGSAVEAFSGDELLQQSRLAPFDAFAIWLHFKQARLRNGDTVSQR